MKLYVKAGVVSAVAETMGDIKELMKYAEKAPRASKKTGKKFPLKTCAICGKKVKYIEKHLRTAHTTV